jgi:endonuclease YncB( thermonuclease family)
MVLEMEEHDYKTYPELTNSEIEEFGFTSPFPQIVDDFDADVVKVHDGDTVSLSCNFRDFVFPLRMAEIDAPELSTGAPGAAARDWLKSKIEGKHVHIEIDQANRVEKGGRLMGKVIYTGMNIGDEEIYLGLATPYGDQGDEIPAIEWFLHEAVPWQ